MGQYPAHCGWCHPWAARPRFYKKQADQASHGGASQQSAPLHGLCISSCLQAPALLEFLSWHPSLMNCDAEVSANKPFPPQVALVMVFHPSNKNPNKDRHFLPCASRGSSPSTDVTLWTPTSQPPETGAKWASTPQTLSNFFCYHSTKWTKPARHFKSQLIYSFSLSLSPT